MSYILFLGFKSTVYKTAPTIRASLNNNFLDEFDLESNTQCNLDDQRILDNLFLDALKKNEKINTIPRWRFFYKKLSSFFHKDIIFQTIELDERLIEKSNNQLLLEFFMHNDNNYTNGFMTQSSMVSLYFVYLIPKSILLNVENFFDTYEFDEKRIKTMDTNIEDIKKHYKKRKLLFDLLSENRFAQSKSFLQDLQENELFYHRYIDNKKILIKKFEWLGNDGFMELFFSKETVKYENNSPEKFDSDPPVIYGLYNKYLEYENQRNTD